jgi:hypothetical protein
LTLNVPVLPGQILLLDFSAAWEVVGASDIGVYFRITINGTTWRSAACSANPSTGPTYFGTNHITGRVAIGSSGLVSGTNAIVLQWRRVGIPSATIDTTSDGEHAALRATVTNG